MFPNECSYIASKRLVFNLLSVKYLKKYRYQTSTVSVVSAHLKFGWCGNVPSCLTHLDVNIRKQKLKG